MIKFEGILVAVRKTQKGKNLYVGLLPNGSLVKILTDKAFDLYKSVSVSTDTFIARDNQLILILK